MFEFLDSRLSFYIWRPAASKGCTAFSECPKNVGKADSWQRPRHDGCSDSEARYCAPIAKRVAAGTQSFVTRDTAFPAARSRVNSAGRRLLGGTRSRGSKYAQRCSGLTVATSTCRCQWSRRIEPVGRCGRHSSVYNAKRCQTSCPRSGRLRVIRYMLFPAEACIERQERRPRLHCDTLTSAVE